MGSLIEGLKAAFPVLATIAVILGVVLVGWMVATVKVAKSTPSWVPPAPSAMGPPTNGVYFVRFFSGPSQGTSGRFQVTEGQVVFWNEHATQPTWAIAAAEMGVYATNPLEPPPGNLVLYWQGTEVACLVSRTHSADPRAGLSPAAPGFAQALFSEAESFIAALRAQGAKFVGRD